MEIDPTQKEIVDLLGDKVSKREAAYKAANSPQDNCGNCEFYLYPGNSTSECERVAGVVYDEDICKLYRPEGQAAAPVVEAPE